MFSYFHTHFYHFRTPPVAASVKTTQLTTKLIAITLVVNFFLSFIDHSFEECRKILKMKQREGGIVNTKLI